jgi:hypothetical protein
MNKSYENFIGSAALVIEEYTGIKLSIEKVAEIIGNKMDNEWNVFVYDEVSVYMDTSPREHIVEYVAQYYLGRGWPTYRDKIDMHDFHGELNAKMKVDAQ